MKNKILKLINDNHFFAIMTHVMPDGDALGSAFATKKYLENLGKKVIFISEETIPNHLSFLELNPVSIDAFNNLNEMPDVFISLDSGDLTRLGDCKSLFEKANVTLNIDHHKTNTEYADINYIVKDASATGEVLFDIMNKSDIDSSVAEGLYVAIVTDTGNFMYSNTTSKTFQIASELLKYDINMNEINVSLFQNKPMHQIKLLSESIYNMHLKFNNQVAFTCVTQEMLSRTGADISDADGIVEYIRNIEGVEVSILLKELASEEVKVSMRSKNAIDVSKIVQKFDGGGHSKAAGCTIYKTISKAEKVLSDEIKKIMEA